MNTVSTSSGTFEKMNSMTHSPHAPSPYVSSAVMQMVSRKGSVAMLCSRCGAVRSMPQKLKRLQQ
eukprot:9573-Eustigmatos_ZCMA.PRE.1